MAAAVAAEQVDLNGRFMYFKQFYLGCLAHASYLIGSDGEGAVVDPQRDVEQYLQEIQVQGLKLRYILETHLHADFVSGHRELALRTGAQIVFGKRAGAAFEHLALGDGDELRIGRIVLKILETPGHTPEGISILATDTSDPNTPLRIFTGDTLFIGDVGRPDLIGSKGFSPEQMAGMLYESLHSKLLTLPDEVEVYPAHGAGSLCGRNLSRETMSTIGEQKKLNYALQPMEKESFVKMMTTDLPEAPSYFATDAEINRTGAAALGELPQAVGLSPREVSDLLGQDHQALDVRQTAAFGTGHVPCSLNIGLSGQFASWAGSLIPIGTPLILVTEDETAVAEAVTRLARIGLESVSGYLEGGIYAWDRAGLRLAQTPQMPIDELHARIHENSDLQILDVRRSTEFAVEHVPGATNIPLTELMKAQHVLKSDRPTAVMCASGYRSSAATSLLEQMGWKELFNVVGGTAAWTSAGYPTERMTAK